MQETLDFNGGKVEVSVIDNVIYMKVVHFYNDDIAMAMTRYLDKVIDEIPNEPIRVWDSGDLSQKSFQLTSECIKAIAKWSDGVKSRRPGSKAYFIAREPLVFGISRMYQMLAGDDKMDVQVLKSIDELPKEIREKIPASS
jgi:hypothetical protein